MTAKVVTIGLGYIGLPTSALIASVGTKVLGVDIKPEVVNTINKGKIHITEPDLEELVSKTASEIKSLKPVEPYKGKGIKEKNQFVIRKEGKKK